MGVKQLFKEAVAKDLISVKEYNEGIYIFVVYRIVWETQAHELLFSFDNEDDAAAYCTSHGPDQYKYDKIRIN